ncbi:MAG: hypothetical protein QGH33_20815, partial [Pirellulaceae bacterium]|nr:hypothetical protein [Pirellulaceae bacterium]
MKTSWGKPVHVIRFIRTLLIALIAGAAPTWSQQAAEISDISGQPQVSEIVEPVRSSKPASGTWRTIALPGLDGSDTEAAWTTALAAHLGGEAEQEIDGVVAGR